MSFRGGRGGNFRGGRGIEERFIQDYIYIQVVAVAAITTPRKVPPTKSSVSPFDRGIPVLMNQQWASSCITAKANLYANL